MGKFELTARQKDEIRRLTQKANRRIKQAYREYKKAGREIAPFEVTGGIQLKSQWETPKNPLSRSVSFSSKSEYIERLTFLKQFDRPLSKGGAPTMTQYTEMQRFKTLKAIESSLGGLDGNLPSSVKNVLHDILNMSSVELSDFWERFSVNSARAGLQYSSEAVMASTMAEFFDEDIAGLFG